MAVLPKYQLKELFEAGDLMTESTLGDFIDSAYNPVLVAGTDIQLTTVSTPSGDTITISSTGGAVTGLTTTGTSGPATLNSGTGILNIPIYSNGSFGDYTNFTPTIQDFPGTEYPNIPQGSTFINQTFVEMMNRMLYPTVNPTLTPPSSSFTLTLADGSTGGSFNEIGKVHVIGDIVLTSTFDEGLIDPQFTALSDKRSGLPNAYNYTGGGGIPTPLASTLLTNSTSNTVDYTIIQGYNNWTSFVSYDEGVQPKNSIGGDFDFPLAAGDTTQITQSIIGVYPPFATTVSINTLTKQPLQSMTSPTGDEEANWIYVDMVSETYGGVGGVGKQKIDIPDVWEAITGVDQFGSFSGSWNPVPLTLFTQSAVTQTIQGNIVNYTRYTHNGSNIGPRSLRFKTS